MKLPNESNQRKHFLTILRKIRNDKGLTQVELADRLGAQQSFVSKYEAGARRLDFLELRYICITLGISLENLLQELEKGIDVNETK
jgi:transcriptional regulator with XRE-family HTH domain